MKILGIDPGSRTAGYGIVELKGNSLKLVCHGAIKLQVGSKTTPMPPRLAKLHAELEKIIQMYKPDVVCVEKVFFAKNPMSALKLGQARGIALLVGAQAGLKVTEYSPTEIKQSVAGAGRADKAQVARMVQMLLGGAQEFATHDASDALAIAICEAHQQMSWKSRVTQGLHP